MTKLLTNAISALTYLILSAPLIIAPWFVYPFIAPKAVFFWVLSEIIFALWAILALANKRYRPRENLLFYAILGFLLITLLASFRGVNLTTSLFSTFERMTGFITLAHGFLIYLALSSTFKNRKEWKNFLRGAVFVGGIAAAIFFLDDSIISFLPEARQGSTLGNSSFFGAYIIFPIFFAIYLFLSDKGWKRIFAFICEVIMIFAMYYSGASGAWYAFLGGIFIIFLAWMYFRKPRNLEPRISLPLEARRAKWGNLDKRPLNNFLNSIFHILNSKTIPVALFVFSVCVAGFIAYGTVTQNQAILEYLPDEFSRKRIGARLVVWENAWDAIKERPVLGWGPENFQTAFVKYFNPCLPLPDECGGEIWFDKAHNIIIDTLVASGFAGLFAYFSIFVIAVYSMWKKYFHETWNTKHKAYAASESLPNVAKGGFRVSRFIFHDRWHLPSVLTALLAAYFVQNLFVFDMPTTYLMFFFVLAMVGGITSKIADNQDAITKQIQIISIQNSKKSNRFSIKPVGYWLFENWLLFGYCILVIGVSSVSIYFFGYQSLRSAHLVWQTMHTRVPNIENRLNLYLASLGATPLGSLQTRQSFTNNAILWLQQEISFPEKTLKTIEREAERMALDNPSDLRSNLILGNFYNAMVKYHILKLKDKDTARIYLEKAKVSLEKAFQLSPTNQQIYLSLSQNYIFRKQYDAAEQILQKAIDLEPRYGDSHYNLGDLYMITKEFEKSAQKFDEALALGYRVDTVGKASQIAQAYYETKQYEKAAKWYEEVVIRKPKDPDARWTLATIYKELKEFDKAKAQASIVSQIDEKYKEAVEEFIDNNQ